MVNVAEVIPFPGWRHPRTNWRRRPDNWLFAFYEGALQTTPLGAWAARLQAYTSWVVDAVHGPAIVRRAGGQKRPTASEPGRLGRHRVA